MIITTNDRIRNLQQLLPERPKNTVKRRRFVIVVVVFVLVVFFACENIPKGESQHIHESHSHYMVRQVAPFVVFIN